MYMKHKVTLQDIILCTKTMKNIHIQVCPCMFPPSVMAHFILEGEG